MTIYQHNQQGYYSTREAMKNGQQFPSIFWAMSPMNIIGKNKDGESDIFYPIWVTLDFKGLPLGDPFEGMKKKNIKGEISDF